MSKVKFISALVIAAAALSCSKITQTVEEKVNKQIDETIDSKIKEYDSTLSKKDMDSLKEMFKDVNVDSLLMKLDSLGIKEENQSKKKTK